MKGQSSKTIATSRPQEVTECFKCGSYELVEAIPMQTFACLDCDAEMAQSLPVFSTYDSITFKVSGCHKKGNLKPL